MIADRVLEPTDHFHVAGEGDRFALAAMDAVRRDLVGIEDLEPWLARLAEHAGIDPDDAVHPFRRNGNVQSFLRALHLQLALAPARPLVRPDLILALLDRLRSTNAAYLRAAQGPSSAATSSPESLRL